MGLQRQDLAAEQPIAMYFVEKYSKARSIKDQKTWMQWRTGLRTVSDRRETTLLWPVEVFERVYRFLATQGLDQCHLSGTYLARGLAAWHEKAQMRVLPCHGKSLPSCLTLHDPLDL